MYLECLISKSSHVIVNGSDLSNYLMKHFSNDDDVDLNNYLMNHCSKDDDVYDGISQILLTSEMKV